MNTEAAIQTVLNVIQAPKSALTVSGMTTAVGAGEYYKVLPLGEITLAIGIISTVTMCFIQLARFLLFWKAEKDNSKLRKLEREKAHLEIEALKKMQGG